MFLFRSGLAAVLLLALTESSVPATLEDNFKRPLSLAENIFRPLQFSWVDGIDALTNFSRSACAGEAAAVLESIQAGQLWALQMLDASSKIQSGILQGNLRDLGMYEQCVRVNEEYNNLTIKGKHCTVSFNVISSSVCVPSACNESQVSELVNAAIQNVTEIGEVEFEINAVSCVRVGTEDFTTGEILTIAFFSFVGIFIIFCTCCEFMIRTRPTLTFPIMNELAKFSLYTNIITMLNTDVKPEMMPAIQGIRFLSMSWVVLGHRFLITMGRPMVNALDILEWYNAWTSVYIQAAPFAVDTFFVVSGFLMSYMYLKMKQSGKRSNFHVMYIHRYLRLTPCLAVLMLFVAVLLHRFTNGPLWQTVLTFWVERCRKNWWVNLLYVQNFVRVEEMCLPHSWYLAVDMQLFWISPFVLYPLYRWPKFGLGSLILFLIASVVTPAVVLGLNGYSNALIRLNVDVADMLDDFNFFYIPTYNRACAYFVGILMGYDVAKKKRYLTRWNVAINWLVACILLGICGLATTRIYDTSIPYNLTLEIIFAILLRPFWSIGIAWIVYACTYGYGGLLGRFLSLPVFLPLSRVSYCIYLVHMVIQAMKIGAAQTPGRFSGFLILSDFWGDVAVSFTMALILSLFFESPVVVLEKMLTTPRRKQGRVNQSREIKKDVDNGIDNKGMTEA